MSGPYLRNSLNSISLTILLNSTKIKYPLVSIKDLGYLPISTKDLKYPLISIKNLKYLLNPKN